MRVLLIDGMNFMHRARSGFAMGEHAVTFNFFRNLKALVDKIRPNECIFVLEGTPRKRLAEFAEYKANREETVDPGDPKSLKRAQELADFYRQADECIDLLKRAFPITVVRHPDYECDDVIYTLCKRGREASEMFKAGGMKTEIVVASNDSDFTQLLNQFPKTSTFSLCVYNPHLKEYVECPPYDYVTWKSLRGDPTDNIPNIPGVGDKRAIQAVSDPTILREILDNPEHNKLFELNKRLIAFTDIDDLERMETWSPTPDWVEIVGAFKSWEFNSFFKPTKTGTTQWDKFKETFGALSNVGFLK